MVAANGDVGCDDDDDDDDDDNDGQSLDVGAIVLDRL